MVLICFVTLHLLDLSPLTLRVFVKFPGSSFQGVHVYSKKKVFPDRHVIIIWNSVSLVSHMNLSVLINSNGVSLLVECWDKRCSPFSSAAVSSPI